MSAAPVRSSRPPAWVRDAACIGFTELFFPRLGERESARLRREREALDICEHCVVRIECRDHARSHGEIGIWGGETEEQRRAAAVPVRRPRRRYAEGF